MSAGHDRELPAEGTKAGSAVVRMMLGAPLMTDPQIVAGMLELARPGERAGLVGEVR